MLSLYEGKLSYRLIDSVEDYLREAKNHVPEAMKSIEDALLAWLRYHNYDPDEAIKSLIESFK